MKKILASWIGDADLYAARENKLDKPGPIAQAMKWSRYNAIELLTNRSTGNYAEWLKAFAPNTEIGIHCVKIAHPNDLKGIYKAADNLITTIHQKHGKGAELTFQVSAGTPIMAGAWMLLANAARPATLIESSTGTVNKVDIPFEITARYIRSIDESIERINSSVVAKFVNIIHKSEVMAQAVVNAARLAQHDITALIYGESGTGKELFARAIHDASNRVDKPFIPVNCGAIPENLIESILFGHTKGAFTGAERKQPGLFMAANGGTLFLDEIGDLPLHAQVKLLRAIDTQKITMVGETAEEEVNVRIVAATHRNLQRAVKEGKFRLDLFYRLAVGFVEIPPLKDRHGDIELLVNDFLKKANQKLKISSGAMKALSAHHWPGNVRELKNTISRCCYKTTGDMIQEETVRAAFIQIDLPASEDVLNRDFTDDFNIDRLTDEVACHYIVRAMEKSGGRKTSAAKMLGLGRVTFENRLKKYGLL